MKLAIIVATLALLSCVNTAAPDVFLGVPEQTKNQPRNLVMQLNELSTECTDLLNNVVISEYTMSVAGNPTEKTLDVTLLLTLNKNLFKCNKANSDSKYENIQHMAYWMDKPNNHANPFDNVDVNQEGCNCDTKKILTTCADGETAATKLASDACKAAAAANPEFINTILIPESDQDNQPGSWWIMKDASGSSGVGMTVEYHFDQEYYDKLVEQKFYDVKTNEQDSDVKLAYEESEWAVMHEIFMLEAFNDALDPVEFDWGMTRWWEFELTIRFYLELVPARSEPFKVIAREIKVPPCDTCVVVFKQSAILEFVEEKVRTGTDPCPAALETIDWEKARDMQKPFCSLEKVLMRIYIKDVKNPRKFVLQMFNYDYGNRNQWFEIYNRAKDVRSSSKYFEDPYWNPTLKQLQLTITSLQLGQSAQNLMYQAQVRLCQFDDTASSSEAGTDENWSCDPVYISQATEAEGGTGVQGTIGVTRRRVLAEDKEVIQKYTSEVTDFTEGGDEAAAGGTVGGKKKDEEGGSAVIIIVVVVVIAAVVGIGIGVYFHMKKSKGSSGGDQPENNARE